VSVPEERNGEGESVEKNRYGSTGEYARESKSPEKRRTRLCRWVGFSAQIQHNSLRSVENTIGSTHSGSDGCMHRGYTYVLLGARDHEVHHPGVEAPAVSHIHTRDSLPIACQKLDTSSDANLFPVMKESYLITLLIENSFTRVARGGPNGHAPRGLQSGWFCF
jgi:hypothetical protein